MCDLMQMKRAAARSLGGFLPNGFRLTSRHTYKVVLRACFAAKKERGSFHRVHETIIHGAAIVIVVFHVTVVGNGQW